MKRALVWLVLLLFCTVASPAAAQSDSQLKAARALADAGFELLEKKEFDQAFERFASAERIVHAPTHMLYMAKARLGAGKLVEARDILRKLLAEELTYDANETFADAQIEAGKDLDALEKRLAHVTISVSGPGAEGATLSVDGSVVTPDDAQDLAVNPGKHRIVARVDSGTEVAQTIDLPEGGSASVELSLAAIAAPDPEPQQPDAGASDGGAEVDLLFPALVMGVGVAGLVVGGVTGGLAMGKAKDLEKACPVRTACPEEHQGLEKDARTLGNTSTAMFVIGGAALAAGSAWLIVNLLSDGGGDATAAWRVHPETLSIEF